MSDTWNFGLLKNLIRKRVDHSGIEGVVEDFLNETVQDIISRKSFRFMTVIVNVDTVASQETLALPADTDSILMMVDITNNIFLELLTEFDWFERFAPESSPSESQPKFVAFFEGDKVLRFRPIPSGIFTIELLTTKEHPIMEKDDVVPSIPQKWMSVIVDGTVMRIKSYQDRRTIEELQRYESGIERMIAKDGVAKGVALRMKDQFLNRRRRGPFFKTGGFIY